ncbi:hypothetical protein C7271_07945 [filamentous cyanobacterium CCP5]|nr:hypothetical protein C7271_07945 [filamentous cyanobacterium CCP5]
MPQLNRTTLQRLKKLPQFAGLWEGDRRCLEQGKAFDFGDGGADDDDISVDCILWVDGMQGELRSVAMVPSDSGYEPLVRTLLQAMEHPQGDQAPARPKKIVVRERETQFYLRGVLQDLGIVVEYAPQLPLIDSFFEALAQSEAPESAQLPEPYADDLLDKAMELWEIAPWYVLNEQQILKVELNGWDVESFYISVLGMGGVDYGLLMYRSLESLVQFRRRVLENENSPKQLQEAFLEQDCLYVNFELIGASQGPEAMPSMGWGNPPPEAVRPDFGSLHPLEGMRTEIAEEEAIALLVAMEGLKRFFSRYYNQLERPPFPALEGSYRVPNPDPEQGRKTHSVKVKTLPEVTADIEAETEQAFLQDAELRGLGMPALRDDYVPEGSIVMLLRMPPGWLTILKLDPLLHFQSDTEDLPEQGLPVVVIQTTRPKGKTLIQQIQQAGGVQSICFNSGHEPMTGAEFQLGLIHTANGEFQLFAEYELRNAGDRQQLNCWQRWIDELGPQVGVVIASGVTGKQQGRPTLRELLGFFSAKAKSAAELGLPPLQLQYAMDWEME